MDKKPTYKNQKAYEALEAQKRSRFIHNVTQRIQANESTSMTDSNEAERQWIEQKPGEWIF